VGGGNHPSVIDNPAYFSGCGGNSVWDLRSLTFSATWPGRHVFMCVDRVRLV
jgi:hypothetical protein